MKKICILLFQLLVVNYFLFHLIFLAILPIIHYNSLFSPEVLGDITQITGFDTLVALSQIGLALFLYLTCVFLLKNKITRLFILVHGIGFLTILHLPFIGIILHLAFWSSKWEVLFYDIGLFCLLGLTLYLLYFAYKKKFTLSQIYSS